LLKEERKRDLDYLKNLVSIEVLLAVSAHVSVELIGLKGLKRIS
jgi:hypothetical protein